MIDLTLDQLREQTPPNTPWFGLDLGEKTIGVATSDPARVIASPLQLIRKTKFTDDAHALLKLMDGRGASGLVIGLPLNMDGSEGPRAQSCRAFARNLQRLRAVPVAFQDERLSTSAVERSTRGPASGSAAVVGAVGVLVIHQPTPASRARTRPTRA